MKALIFLSICSVLMSCTINQNFSELHKGDILKLQQPLRIAADIARINIQYGKVIPFSQIERYDPHCRFISWKLVDKPRIISPDVFMITNIRQTYDLVWRLTGGFRLSSLGFTGNSLTAVDYSTEIDIYSERQPDIKRVICSHWEDPDDAQHLSLKQIQQALGDIASIRQYPHKK